MSRRRRRQREDSFIFEPRTAPLLPRYKFYLRLARTAAIAVGVVLFSLLLGALGFHYIENMAWLDATLNAAMLLSGMGPLDRPICTTGKVFAACYALFSGVVFLTVAALLFAPIFHRLIHKFHLDVDEAESDSK
jgi:hypothetical protein